MTLKTVTIGTRGSDLARWQTNHIADLLQQSQPLLTIKTRVIATKGDRVLDTPLPLIGGKGVFTAELEAALQQNEIDFAVHSLKDLPTEDPDGLTIGAIPQRINPADVLISREGYTLETLPKGAAIGTSSNRRASQLLHHRPDLTMIDIRGNIDTRIRKALDPNGPYDAIVLAYAGVFRLNLQHVISEMLTFEQMLPAPGQGALAVQCRSDDDSIQTLEPVQDHATATAVIAERAFLAALGGGCSVPVAAYARPENAELYVIEGRVGALDGRQQIAVQTNFMADSIASARNAGEKLAQEAMGQGADYLLRLDHE